MMLALVCGTSARAATLGAIPGLSGLPAQSAARLDNGAAIILVPAENRVTLARIGADGALDRRYGTRGLAQVPVPDEFEASVMTIDPATGAAWISGVADHRAYVIAVSPQGSLVTGFGSGGTLAFVPQSDEELDTLAWKAGRLLITPVAAGCENCGVIELSAATGRMLSYRTLYDSQLAGRCSPPAGRTVAGAGAAWVGNNILLSTGGYGHCPPQTLEFSGALSERRALVATPAPARVFAPVLASDGSQVCEGGNLASGTYATVLWGAGQSHVTTLLRDGSGNEPIMVPIGGGACSALVDGPSGHQTPESVFQIARGGARPVRTILPRNFDAGTMYRRKAGLVVVGTVGGAAHTLVVPLVRGTDTAGLRRRG
jgi:hypothetical protein